MKNAKHNYVIGKLKRQSHLYFEMLFSMIHKILNLKKYVGHVSKTESSFQKSS